jgi:glycosyltransferase involved in cell wall biosynthesis
MTIVFASHSPFDECLVVGSHHLASALAEAGHKVWHIGPPVTPVHVALAIKPKYRSRLLKSLRAPEQLQDNLIAMDPFSAIPWQVAKWTIPYGNLFVLSSNIATKLAKAGGLAEIDVLLVDDPRFSGLEKLLKPRAVFYRATDLYAEMKEDPKLTTAERQLLQHCSGIIGTSQPVLLHLMGLKPGLPSLQLENGVDWGHFSKPMEEPEELKGIPHPRVIYVGAVDFRFDYDVLGYMAEQIPEAHFVIIGPGKLNHVRDLGRSNIHILGPKPYQLIPGFLQYSDIGILPLVDNLANSGRSPMKLYEYGTAGLPVVARYTQELTRRAESFVSLFSSKEEAVERVINILKAKVDRKAISESCKVHSWANKISTLVEFILKTAFSPKASNEFLSDPENQPPMIKVHAASE